MNQIALKACENCQKAPATVRYNGEDLCRPCAKKATWQQWLADLRLNP